MGRDLAPGGRVYDFRIPTWKLDRAPQEAAWAITGAAFPFSSLFTLDSPPAQQLFGLWDSSEHIRLQRLMINGKHSLCKRLLPAQHWGDQDFRASRPTKSHQTPSVPRLGDAHRCRQRGWDDCSPPAARILESIGIIYRQGFSLGKTWGLGFYYAGRREELKKFTLLWLGVLFQLSRTGENRRMAYV